MGDISQVEEGFYSSDPDSTSFVAAEIIMDESPWRTLTESIPKFYQLIETAYCKAAPDASVAAEVSIMFQLDEAVHHLNRDYRHKDKATNVLSFNSYEREDLDAVYTQAKTGGPPVLLGDIFIAYETCKREAEEQSKSLLDHTMHLVVHGMLHLLGHDHIEDKEAEIMEALERDILTCYGIDDPYKGER
ncbi:rRNA maturation RNase YbeY [Temperatibacter marinus]|uniref:Endoribonuclease YbeY n=1 Tax=Temperatibacter marinus TaxID=1456591 RepID=A0AA52EEI4_9PROT|nr:rRNA maturation RNase YbeY [Temperatibacter marinus]WND01345.1 rRNA maturation RNase YbeY [Temperatibacter marinus]